MPRKLLAIALALAPLLAAGCQTPLQGMMKQQSPVLGAVDDSKQSFKGFFGEKIGEGTDAVLDREEGVGEARGGADGAPGGDWVG